MSDLIRREEAIEMLQEAIDSYPPTMKGQGRTRDSTLEEAIDLIKSIPTAEPKVGTWIELNKSEDGTHNIQCTYCRWCAKSKGHANSFYTAKHFSYCPHCGAEMRTEF